MVIVSIVISLQITIIFSSIFAFFAPLRDIIFFLAKNAKGRKDIKNAEKLKNYFNYILIIFAFFAPLRDIIFSRKARQGRKGFKNAEKEKI